VLTTVHELELADAAFQQVFGKASDVDPFDPRIVARLLLYPIDYTSLDRTQFEAVATAAAQIGETTAYWAGFGGEEAGWGGTYDHRIVDLGDHDGYEMKDGRHPFLEHFLYSPGGEWGVVTSRGSAFALVGGSEEFIATVRGRLAYDEERVVREFVSDWRELETGGASVDWVPVLLDHVLGAGEGSRRWKE
jgi:hypothetical protein